MTTMVYRHKRFDRVASTMTCSRLQLLVWLQLSLAVVVSSTVVAQTAVPVGDEFQVNGYTTGTQSQPAAAQLTNGGFVVVWTSTDSFYGPDASGTSIEGQCYDADRERLGFEFQVNVYSTGDQVLPEVGPQPGGGFVVVWQSAGSALDTSASTIVGRRYDTACQPLGSELQVNDYTTDTQANPSLAMAPDGSFVVVWDSYGSFGDDTSGASIQARRFGADGMPLGGQLQVNTRTTSYQSLPRLANGPDGDFMVVWETYGSDSGGYNSIRARRLDGDGVPTGGELQVNTVPLGFPIDSYWYPTVAATATGEFLVVWTSDGSPGDDLAGLSIQARAYDGAAGTPLTNQVQVNSFTANNQRLPEVAASGDRFLVSWESDGSSGFDISALSLQARRLDTSGALVGDEFQLNAYTTGSQAAPAITHDAAGDLLVLWESFGSWGTDDSSSSIQLLPFGLDSDGDGVADEVDCAPADPDAGLLDPCGTCGGDGTPCVVFSDDFELGDTTAWDSTAGG